MTGVLFTGLPSMLLVKKLRQVNDAFRLRQEMLSTMGACLTCVGKNHRGCALEARGRDHFFLLLVLQSIRAAFDSVKNVERCRSKSFDERYCLECLTVFARFSFLLCVCPADGGSAATTTTIQLFVVWGMLPDSRGVHIVTEAIFFVLGLVTAPWR